MKHCTLFIFIFWVVLGRVAAQGIAINSTNSQPHASAMLDVSSTTRGLLVPRMTKEERTAIANPATGLLVYDLTTGSFWFYDGAWQEVPKSAGGGMGGAAGGDLSGTYPSPSVAGILGRPIAGKPAHLQIIKWNDPDNRWQMKDDSLVLPYVVSQSSGAPLFSITNTSAGINGPSIMGRHLTGSGILAGTTSLWGDHTSGAGVTGTSASGNGVVGIASSGAGAGVYGSHSTGFGVLGEISSGNGAGVFGRNNGGGGYAGYFVSLNAANNQPALMVGNSGTGSAAIIQASNLATTDFALRVYGGFGGGIKANMLGTDTSKAAIEGEHNESGIGVYGKSSQGIGVKAEITAVDNSSPALSAVTAGTGSSLFVWSKKTSGPAPLARIDAPGNRTGLEVNATLGKAARFTTTDATAVSNLVEIANPGIGTGLFINTTNGGSVNPSLHIMNNHAGGGLKVLSSNGSSAQLKITSASNLFDVLGISNQGSGESIHITQENVSSTSYAMNLVNSSLGRGIHVNQANASTTAAGINVTSAGTRGITIDVQGTQGLYSIAAGANGIGVEGRANGSTGIGVKGQTGLGSTLGGIGVLGQSGSNDQSGIGVKGVNYSDNETFGAVTGINMASGVGLYGESNGLDGIGVLGVAGQGGFSSKAAIFKNINSSSTKNVVEINNVGAGTNLYLNNSRLTNTSPLFRGVYAGTGNFLTFESNLGDVKTTLSYTGDLKTDGTVTVKTNKGIIRNTNSPQLRYEVLPAAVEAVGGLAFLVCAGCSIDRSFTFSAPFSSPPAVAVGNLLPGFTNADFKFHVIVKEVTTTGCTLRIFNYRDSDTVMKGTWNLIVIGNE